MSKTYLSSRAAALSPSGHFIARSAFILLLWLGGGCVLFAQDNGVKVSNLAVNVGSPTTVTFNVSWKTPMPVALWSDTVWVFVDYNNNGVMERLPVTSATASAGTVKKEPNNDKGVWVIGNARTAGAGGFSATIQLLTATANVAGACAYASNYPPLGEYSSDAPILSFTGMPMYEIQLAKSGGENATVKAGDTFLLPCNYTVTSFTDATGAQGRLIGTPFHDNVNVPWYAASAKTWKVGNQIWSDVINIPTCDKEPFTNSNTDPQCRSYTVDRVKYYYYNWPYVNANASTLCPSPWRVPSGNDYIALDKAFNGSGATRDASAQYVHDSFVVAWGSPENAGGVFASGISNVGVCTPYHALESGHMFSHYVSGYIYLFYTSNLHGGNLVRCVR
jgi:hypothetical protein